MNLFADIEKKPRSLNEATLKEIIAGKRTGLTVREAIAELGRKYGKQQPAFFYSLFKKKKLSPDSRVKALEQYLQHAGLNEESILLKHTGDEDVFVQRYVVNMLAQKGETKALHRLQTIQTKNERLHNSITLALARIASRQALPEGVLKSRLKKVGRTEAGAHPSPITTTRAGKNDLAEIAACLKTEGLQKKLATHLPLLCGKQRYVLSYNETLPEPAAGTLLFGVLLLQGHCPEGYQVQAYVFREEQTLYFLARGGQLLYTATLNNNQETGFELYSAPNALYPNTTVYISGSFKKGKPVFTRAESALVKPGAEKKAKRPAPAVK